MTVGKQEAMPAKPCLDLTAFRPLTKDEIDHRIEQLVSELTDAPAAEIRECGMDEDDCRPRLISAGELVRRMQSFIVFN